MKLVDLHAAAREARARKEHRAAPTIVHDEQDVRLVIFRIDQGQEVPPHRSGSTVTLMVCEGSGEFTGAEEARGVGPGDLAVFAPNELHGMRALDETFVVLAVITPRPGGGAR
jgi:quercetin dioxygenase-like cupin family protein